MTPASRPSYDDELERAPGRLPALLGVEHLELLVADPVAVSDPRPFIEGRPIEHLEYRVPAPDGATELTVSVFRRTDHATPGGAVYFTHGGGMITGDRFASLDRHIDWVERFDLVFVGVEYRLAPHHPYPVPLEDCYAGLVWAAEHADELGFDPARLVIMGQSAGGGLAAGTALLARDRGAPALAGQMLLCPMLDDRDATVSTHQFADGGRWDREQNRYGWTAYLGSRRGGPDVEIYAAPARAGDLSGLPPTYIDVGSAEVFRDEDVAYASAIWASGGDAELHVYPGGFHGFEVVAPEIAISRACIDARERWLQRILA